MSSRQRRAAGPTGRLEVFGELLAVVLTFSSIVLVGLGALMLFLSSVR